MTPDKLQWCPKCGYCSGDDWRQCKGECPVRGSPHFKEKTLEEYGGLLDYNPFQSRVPKAPWRKP